MIPKEQVLEKIWPMGRDKEVTRAVQLIEWLVGDDGVQLIEGLVGDDGVPEVQSLHLPGDGGEGQAGHTAPEAEAHAPHLYSPFVWGRVRDVTELVLITLSISNSHICTLSQKQDIFSNNPKECLQERIPWQENSENDLTHHITSLWKFLMLPFYLPPFENFPENQKRNNMSFRHTTTLPLLGLLDISMYCCFASMVRYSYESKKIMLRSCYFSIRF